MITLLKRGHSKYRQWWKLGLSKIWISIDRQWWDFGWQNYQPPCPQSWRAWLVKKLSLHKAITRACLIESLFPYVVILYRGNRGKLCFVIWMLTEVFEMLVKSQSLHSDSLFSFSGKWLLLISWPCLNSIFYFSNNSLFRF